MLKWIIGLATVYKTVDSILINSTQLTDDSEVIYMAFTGLWGQRKHKDTHKYTWYHDSFYRYSENTCGLFRCKTRNLLNSGWNPRERIYYNIAIKLYCWELFSCQKYFLEHFWWTQLKMATVFFFFLIFQKTLGVEIALSLMVKEIEVILCFRTFAKKLKIQNGCHFLKICQKSA